MCVLLGYGADAICPYLVFDLARNLQIEGVIGKGATDEEMFHVSYLTALTVYRYLVRRGLLCKIDQLIEWYYAIKLCSC